jgi:GntR family transcriptional regulator
MARPPAKMQRIADEIMIRIMANTYPPDQWIPSAQELAEEFGADRNTVRKALRRIEETHPGLVEIVHGNGAKVLPRPVTRHAESDMSEDIGPWRGFGAAATRAGQQPETNAAFIGEVAATPEVGRWLGVPTDTTVLLRDRTHLVVKDNGTSVPAEIARTWITMSCVERLPILREKNTGDGGMTKRFIEAGYSLSYSNEGIARHANASEQERLRVGPNFPVMEVWRRTYDADGRILKVSSRVINTLLHQVTW